jgi:hypothetical protein
LREGTGYGGMAGNLGSQGCNGTAFARPITRSISGVSPCCDQTPHRPLANGTPCTHPTKTACDL